VALINISSTKVFRKKHKEHTTKKFIRQVFSAVELAAGVQLCFNPRQCRIGAGNAAASPNKIFCEQHWLANLIRSGQNQILYLQKHSVSYGYDPYYIALLCPNNG